MNLDFLVGPLVGAVIGGITNGIAIKMLFRPLKSIKIGRFTLPFTPGVIPKEKDRIAKKVGTVISQELLNEEVLGNWLLRNEIYEQIGVAVDRYLYEYSQKEESLHDLLCESVGKERSMYYVCEAEEIITEKLYAKIVSMELGKVIVEKVVEAYKKGSFGNLLGPMSFFVNDHLVESLVGKIEPIVTQFISSEGEGIIRKAIEEESTKFLEAPIKNWAEKFETYNELIKKAVIKLYVKVVKERLSNILKTLNIAQIVEERILSFNMAEMEQIILSIMRKELNAIIWFGVLLGMIMGGIMNLF